MVNQWRFKLLMAIGLAMAALAFRWGFALLPNWALMGTLAFLLTRLFPTGAGGLAIGLFYLVLGISDYYLGGYPGIEWVYVAYLPYFVLSRASLGAPWFFSWGAGLLGSIGFFGLSNFGVWFVTDMYPPTFEGLVACMVAAIPFFKATLVSDAIGLGSLLFLLERWMPPVPSSALAKNLNIRS